MKPALLLLAAIVLPASFASGYQLFQLTMVAVYAVAILGLTLVTGLTGQISLGHGAFYALGAYTTAILMDQFACPYWLTLPVSAVICWTAGFLVSFPALRLSGPYLALTTFALAIATPQLLKYRLFEGMTGGVQGIVLDKPDAPLGLPISPDLYVYLFVLAVAVLLFLATSNLVQGRIGRAMRAIRDNPLAAEAMGVNVAMVKTRSFAVSATLTGLAGSLGAVAVGFVSPDSFSFFLSITLFVGLLIGGSTSIRGAVVGAVFIEFIPNLAENVSKAAPGAVYGVILIALMFLLPGGAASLPGRLLAWPRQRSQRQKTRAQQRERRSQQQET